MEFVYGVRPPVGASVSVDMTITPTTRDAIFARLRPRIEHGRGARLTVGPTRVVVEGLTDSEADSIREALEELVRELSLDAIPKGIGRKARAPQSGSEADSIREAMERLVHELKADETPKAVRQKARSRRSADAVGA
jgi:hypothetical protein